MIDDVALNLIEQIYRAVLEPSLLPHVIAQIGNAVGGMQECLISSSIGLRSFSQIAPRRDQAFLSQIHEYWSGRTVFDGMQQFGAALASIPANRIVDIRRTLDLEQFMRSDFYHEWWRPQGLGRAALAVRLATSDDIIGFYGVHKPPGDDGFSARETALFRLVVPHLARAIAIRDAFSDLEMESNLQNMIADCGNGVLLVGRAGRLVFSNKTAEAWLRNDSGLRLDGGVVTVCETDAARMLARLIASCGDAGIGDAGPGGMLTIPHPGGSTLRVTVAPFRPPENGLKDYLSSFPPPAALLVVSDPEVELKERKAHLRRQYGLTAAEAEFTLEILKGDGREAAAMRKGISLSTARTHLMRIFDKTGCRRQAELVRLLANQRS